MAASEVTNDMAGYQDMRAADWTRVKRELKDNGYVVLSNVVPPEDCDTYIVQYKEWLDQFGGDWPFTTHSLIQRYGIGHFEPTWNVRLKTKPVFAHIWDTEKLLSSFDAVAIAQPSETYSKYEFDSDSKCWLHLDQGIMRPGLHAIQGAVYLEEATDKDWCFRVMEKSHKFHSDFFENLSRYHIEDFLKLQTPEIDWYKERCCTVKKVSVPKGGIVLWDSRIVHDNARPVRGRENADRWRFVVFVCMAPAKWASARDLHQKRKAYDNLQLTTHWPSHGVQLFGYDTPFLHAQEINAITQLPGIALTKEAKQLAGVECYDFEDGQSDGPKKTPEWFGGLKLEAF